MTTRARSSAGQSTGLRSQDAPILLPAHQPENPQYVRGAPLLRSDLTDALIARFWSHVVKADGCWGWDGCVHECGYGRLSQGPRNARLYLKAHRVSWVLHNGDLDESLVLHGCDNPPCTNPEHLYKGDQLANVADVVERGRARGERNGDAKLTEAQVLEVRALRAQGLYLRQIAALYGVHLATIHLVATGRTWRHVA